MRLPRGLGIKKPRRSAPRNDIKLICHCERSPEASGLSVAISTIEYIIDLNKKF